MNTNSMFPSKWLKADDLGGRKVVLTITELLMEKIGEDEKPVLYFRGKTKGLVLNRVNSNTIALVLGTDETDEWTGGRIAIFPTTTEFQGKKVACIRVEDAIPAEAPKPAARPVPARQQARELAAIPPSFDDKPFEPTDDDVPF